MRTLEELRRLIPETPNEAHLNAGTLSPTPKPVQEAVAKLREEQARQPSIFFFYDNAIYLDRARIALAEWLNAPINNLFLLPNVTTALNIAMQSMHWEQGAEILTTNQEYGAMLLLIKSLEKKHGITCRPVEIPVGADRPEAYVETFEKAISPQTRYLFFSHVSSVSGLVLPAAELCAMARRKGLLSIVDGAHAPGMVPVDIGAIGADVYGANCHKWMMAPCGAGFLTVSNAIRLQLHSLIRGWGDGDYDPSRADEITGKDVRSNRLHAHVENTGVTDRTPQMVMPEVIAFLNEIGQDRMHARQRELSAYARKILEKQGFPCRSSTHPSLCGAMTIFELPKVDFIDLRDRFWHNHKVLCPITSHGDRRFLRVSHAWFNTEAELDQLAQALQAEVRA